MIEFLLFILLLWFEKKTVEFSEIYSKSAWSVKTCEYCFRRFKSDDFDLKNKELPSQLKKFENAESQALLNGNSAWRISINVGKLTVSDCLYTIEKIKKKDKWVHK